MINNNLTYISLFSSAGVGCFGLKQENFLCIATNELLEKRLNIQKINNKCLFDSGYINGDITKQETKDLIFKEIEDWQKQGNDGIDVLIATPPCQGMSVANLKKNTTDINRNSLVIEAIELISKIQPKIFIFENVPAFLKTACITANNEIKTINDAINDELSNNYIFHGETINFKNYGSNSSRTRTLVIGVHKKYQDFISPLELFPNFQKEKTLRETIGHLEPLSYGEFSQNDFYHQSREFPKHMLSWIEDLKEGESAFDNEEDIKKPHKVVNGRIIINQRKNADKYTRQYWDKIACCVHTRSDVLSSQSTIHPSDNRVFSIRELMEMMTIPKEFKWLNKDLKELNNLSLEEKKKLLKKEELNIRQSIGEAVPTIILRQIAKKIKDFMLKEHLSDKNIKEIIEEKKLSKRDELFNYINNNNLDTASLSRLIELANSKREDNAAFFTNKVLLNEIYKKLPEIDKEEIKIIEPAVGIGNFLPYIIKKYENKKVSIDVFDIDNNILNALQILMNKIYLPENITINFINEDSLLFKHNKKYDLFIGNPPFSKSINTKNYTNKFKCTHGNIVSYFIENGLLISDYIVLITPKNLLNTPEYHDLRNRLAERKIEAIIDCGEIGFKGVLVETICLFINLTGKPNKTNIISLPNNINIEQKQKYITDKNLPYWIIYRNEDFDNVFKKLEFDIFTVFRDRQITNSNSTKQQCKNWIPIIKSRNISEDGSTIIMLDNYNSYINPQIAKELSVYKYLNLDNVYLVPNMTYKPRMHKKEKGYIVNGSVAILSLKEKEPPLSKENMLYYSTTEFREFYKIARNLQTRSLNIDNCSVFWFGRI